MPFFARIRQTSTAIKKKIKKKKVKEGEEDEQGKHWTSEVFHKTFIKHGSSSTISRDKNLHPAQ